MVENYSFFDFEFFKATFGPLVGTSTALLVYYLTTRKDRNKERKRKAEESRNRAMYISNLIEDSIVSSRKQLSYFESHVKVTRDDNLELHPLTQLINSNLSRLIKVLSEELSFVIVTKLRLDHSTESSIKIFNSLVSKVDFIDAVITNVLHMVKDEFDYFMTMQTKIQIATDGILANCSMTMIELQKSETNEIEQRFIDTLNGVDKKLKEQPTQDIKAYYNFLVVPLNRDVNSFMTNSFSKLDNLQDVIKSTEESNRLYNELTGTAVRYTANIEAVCVDLTEAINSLEAISVVIKKSINVEQDHS